MTAAAPTADLPASRWSGRLAALSRAGVPDDDPRQVRAREALAFHRCLRVIDAERDQLAPADAAALADSLGDGATTMRT
ncbi:hypothetical protein [Gordonia sp. 852002-51296_SCH5728562-b]|uniref:hypothetical protein n=1 Tax=Gordonia sp. 852002-51296_SCH5728562-b TaxID=1834101 RepID=UPI001E3A7031|nr:hypothetical protein [Gordonia sp. 852002-51296_SCH5728562-b]